MVRTQDGFELAELDLMQRGPGEFSGRGRRGGRILDSNLLRDRQLLELAKIEAARFATAGKSDTAEASEAERKIVRERLKAAWQRRYGLVEAG